MPWWAPSLQSWIICCKIVYEQIYIYIYMVCTYLASVSGKQMNLWMRYILSELKSNRIPKITGHWKFLCAILIYNRSTASVDVPWDLRLKPSHLHTPWRSWWKMLPKLTVVLKMKHDHLFWVGCQLIQMDWIHWNCCFKSAAFSSWEKGNWLNR